MVTCALFLHAKHIASLEQCLTQYCALQSTFSKVQFLSGVNTHEPLSHRLNTLHFKSFKS